jgi:hypothetical protein
MSTAAALAMYAAYIVWRHIVDRRAATNLLAISRQLAEQKAQQAAQAKRLEEIEATLRASPFVNLPTPYKP